MDGESAHAPFSRYSVDTFVTGIYRRSMTQITEQLSLRPVRSCDEAVVRAAHAQMAERGFNFALGLEPAMTWPQYLATLDNRRHGVGLASGVVPETYLLAVVNDEVVGRASIRHTLNARLSLRGGHIGYAVLQHHRRRGYGTAILRRSIPIAHHLGIEKILLTCDADNTASIRIIESCGGILDTRPTEPSEGNSMIRRYWIRPEEQPLASTLSVRSIR